MSKTARGVHAFENSYMFPLALIKLLFLNLRLSIRALTFHENTLYVFKAFPMKPSYFICKLLLSITLASCLHYIDHWEMSFLSRCNLFSNSCLWSVRRPWRCRLDPVLYNNLLNSTALRFLISWWLLRPATDQKPSFSPSACKVR